MDAISSFSPWVDTYTFSLRQEQHVKRDEIFTAEGQTTIHKWQIKTMGKELTSLFRADLNYGVESINLSLCNAVANENAQCRVERDPTHYQLPNF